MKDRNGQPMRAQSASTKRSQRIHRRVQSAKERQTNRNLLDSEPRANLLESPLVSLRAVSKYISTDVPTFMDHPALRGSFVMLPGLGETYGHNLPTVPPPHGIDEDYPFTHEVPPTYVHKPKKYSHPYYERLKSIKGWTCNHSGSEVRVGSRSGETIHRFTINSQRGQSVIRNEIVELERLIKGLTTDWSTCSVALYQNEINDLQQKVKYTLSLTPKPAQAEVFDPTGLRGFCREYDTALQALIERHTQCMAELKEMEEMQALNAAANQHFNK